jgi:hypothetical protein
VEPQVWQALVLIAAWLALAAARLLRPFRVTRTPVRRPVRRHRPAAATRRRAQPGDRAGSWLQTDRIMTIPLAGFRRRLGVEDDAVLRQELARMHDVVWPGRDGFFAS